MCELQALPAGAIRYTTDGSSPSSSGHPYHQPFPVPPGCAVILAQASQDGVVSSLLRVDVPKDGMDDKGEVWRVNLTKPAVWRRRHNLDATSEVFTFLEQTIHHDATLGGVRITVAKGAHWAELFFDDETYLTGEWVRDQATQLRDLIVGANVTLEVAALKVPDGQRLLDLTSALKETPTRDEVLQS